MEPLVLTVDMAGLPQAWVALEEAITYHAKQMVAWSIGGEVREFRGGWQKNGERSRIATKSILAIKGTGAGSHLHAPGLTNSMLFARDRQLCAYCGKRFLIRDLSRDHVVPVSRGGRDSWTNTVTACRSCNTRKGGRSPEPAHMPLLYVPYVPNATSISSCATGAPGRPDGTTCWPACRGRAVLHVLKEAGAEDAHRRLQLGEQQDHDRRGLLTTSAGPLVTAVGAATPVALAQNKIKVAAVYTVPIEQQWSRIHKALNAAKDRGEIEYVPPEKVANADYERVMRETPRKQTFHRRRTVRGGTCGAKVAKDYPKVSFLMGSSGKPQRPNFAVFDNYIQEPA